MNDTSPAMEALYHKLLSQLTPEQRLIRGAGMFDAVREIVLASLPPDLSPEERTRQLYQRIYGQPLPADFFSRTTAQNKNE